MYGNEDGKYPGIDNSGDMKRKYLESLENYNLYPGHGGDPDGDVDLKKYVYPPTNDRDKIFKHFGDDFSLIADNKRTGIPTLPDQGFHPNFQYYESALARITDREALNRPDYNKRCRELVGFAYEQLERAFEKQRKVPKVSIGMKELLRTSISHLENLSASVLEEYKRKGCDVHDSLMGDLGVYQGRSGNRGIQGAKKFYQLVTTDDKDVIDIRLQAPDLVRYESELAVRAVRAFASIAEYERFKGKDEDKEKKISSDENEENDDT